MRIAHTIVAVFALALAARARADVAAYEWVTQGGPNNLIDANPTSCDPAQGCYDRSGRPCSASPNQICDLQIVPVNRCTSGSLASDGGPGLTNTCVWPHGAGHCAGNAHVGCLTDAYLLNPAVTASGASALCAGTGNPTCDTSADPFSGPFRSDCVCNGTDPNAPNFETAVCRGGTPLCSDGDPQRDRGGFGLAFGYELNLGSGNLFSAKLGPAVNGSTLPSTSPRYPIENPPTQFEPQRGAGTINRPGLAVAAVQVVRTTEARERTPLDAALGTELLRGVANSYWADWSFESQPVTGMFNTHTVLLSCAAPVGWDPSQKIDPTPGAPNSGDERYCSQFGRDSLVVHWNRDLTPAELAANPVCPPNCGRTSTHDGGGRSGGRRREDGRERGAQLAVQSGEGAARAQATRSASPAHLRQLLNTNARCRLGGWGNPPGQVGRCIDGPAACDPLLNDASGTPACAGQGGGCRVCNGPLDPNNPLGPPIGYDTHGVADLDLVAGHRIGSSRITTLISIPFNLVGTRLRRVGLPRSAGHDDRDPGPRRSRLGGPEWPALRPRDRRRRHLRERLDPADRRELLRRRREHLVARSEARLAGYSVRAHVRRGARPRRHSELLRRQPPRHQRTQRVQSETRRRCGRVEDRRRVQHRARRRPAPTPSARRPIPASSARFTATRRRGRVSPSTRSPSRRRDARSSARPTSTPC